MTHLSIAIKMLEDEIKERGLEPVVLTSTNSHANEMIAEIKEGGYDVKIPSKKSAAQAILEARKQLGIGASFLARKEKHRQFFGV
tara:strand:- start:162 stop:416 length:255 start_codon:yes stop_codon:yes gene_type:complete